MLGELSLDGSCAPSPPDEVVEEHPPYGPPSLEDELMAERLKVAALQKEVAASHEANAQWILAASSLVNVLLMSPRQNESYASEVSRLLETALGGLSFVETLRYVDCSFPATNAKAPTVRLVRWRALDDSEWALHWAPAWSCELCVDGRQVISFGALLRVENARIEGRLKLAFSRDLTSLTLQFLEMPELHVDVSCSVIVGHVPLPVQETMGSLVRDVARSWIRDNLVAPKHLDLSLYDKKKDLTDDDLAHAKKAALIAAARARDHNTSASSWGRSVSR